MKTAKRLVCIFTIIALSVLMAFQPGFAADNTVDINNASLEELTTLKYVGEVIAKRIIEHREKIQGFKSLEDLLEVKGFGPKTLEANKDRIVIKPMRKKDG